MTPARTPRAADVLRGLVALLGALGLAVGVPVALAAWVGSPLPSEVPRRSDVVDALRDTYIPDEFLVKALAVVCWLVWAQLVVSLVVEMVAYARGRKAGAVPLAGGVQRAAARLVATIALLGMLVSTRTASVADRRFGGGLASPPPATATLVARQVPAGAAVGGDAPAVDRAAASLPTCEVQRRDTLWDIAERHLGDPLRWTEIFALNEGRRQADGGCLTDPDRIEPGWQLVLPAGARFPTAPEVGPTASEPASTPTVDPAAADVGGGMVLLDDDADEGSADPGGGDGSGDRGGSDAADRPDAAAVPASAEATASGEGATSPQPAPVEVTVEPGDNFWTLAEEQLAAAWGRAPPTPRSPATGRRWSSRTATGCCPRAIPTSSTRASCSPPRRPHPTPPPSRASPPAGRPGRRPPRPTPTTATTPRPTPVCPPPVRAPAPTPVQT